MPTYTDFKRQRLGTLTATKAVGWQPTGVSEAKAWHFDGYKGSGLPTYTDFKRQRLGTLTATKAVGWQPTGVFEADAWHFDAYESVGWKPTGF